VLLIEEKVLPRANMSSKALFTTSDVALTGVFCAVWAVLNLTLGPLSFALLHLPVLHDFAAFFTLLLVTWASGRFGVASLVGVVGSVVAIFLGGPLLIAGFAASAVLFDFLMLACRHRIRSTPRSLVVTALATMLSAYFAGVIIGIFFMTYTFWVALTFWGGWHLVGGILTLAITVPIMVSLEKAGARKFRNE
jgi:hypothetical protein